MIRPFFKSFTYAFTGIWFSLQERNMRIHLLAMLIVLFLGWFLNVSHVEWLILFLCIGMVLTAEMFNTALEAICDAIAPLHTDMHKYMGKPKDLGAGAVLISASFSLIVGLIIFLPRLVMLFSLCISKPSQKFENFVFPRTHQLLLPVRLL